MTNLSIQKKHSFAISKVIDFINESDRMRKSYGTYVRVCVDTVLSVLKSIMFKNIVQTIVDDEIEQQLVDIDLYIRMHMEKAVLKDIVFRCIQKRIEIFEKMRKNFEDFTELEQLNMEYNTYLDELENRFHIFYERFPTRQNQCFYIFFQSEVKGNLKKAIQISNTRKFQQTSEGKKVFNVFEPNVLYLTATMGKIWGKIVNFSDKLPIALGYKKQEFNYITHIKDIMPTSIAAIHDEIIRCMMTQGNDSIINNKRQIFLRNKSNFLIRVNVFISLNLYYTDELPFGVFVTPIETRSGFLFVTSLGYVEGMDSNILNQVGYNNVLNLPPFYQFRVQTCLPEFDHYAQHMDDKNLNLFDKVDVPFNFFSRSHPQFQKIFTTKSQSIQESIRALSESSFRNFSEQGSSMRLSMKKMGSTQGQVSNLLRFKADITIERHRIKMLDTTYVYYIVEIKYLSRVTNNEEYFTMSSGKTMNLQTTIMSIHNQQKSQFVGQKKEKQLQKDVTRDSLSYSEEKFDMNFKQDDNANAQQNKQLDDALTERQQHQQFLGIGFTNPDVKTSPNDTSLANNILNTLRDDQNNMETLQSAIRDEINLDKVHVTERQAAKIQSNHQNTGNHMNMSFSIQKSNLNVSQVDTHDFQNLDISVVNQLLIDQAQTPNLNASYAVSQDVSAMNSGHKIFQNQDSQLKGLKSKDLNQNLNENDENLINQQIQVNPAQLNNGNNGEQKKEHKKKSYNSQFQIERGDLKVKLQKDEREGSLASSTDALNRSLDKYNYYEEFISSQHHPLHLKMIKIGRFIEYLILLIATIASILTLYTSFDNLLKNIDTLTLNSNILQPYGNSLVLSNNNYLLSKYGTNDQKQLHSQILSQRLTFQFQQYDEMIKDEWRNDYLTSYFTDEELEIIHPFKLLDQPYLQSQNLLAASSRLLFSLHDVQLYTDKDILNQFNLPERQFLVINYPQFLIFFKDLVKNTLDKSISYNNDLVRNIIIQTVILNVITLFIFCLSGWNYYLYSKSLISILKMCETASTLSVEREMYNFQKMQDMIAENENILFNYVFNIQQKEIELTRQVDRYNYYEQKQGGGNSFGQSGTKRKKLLVNVQHEKLHYAGFALFIIIIYLLFVVFTITTYAINTSFLNQFEPAIKYYKHVSDTNFEISELPSLKVLMIENSWQDADPNKLNNVQYTQTNLTALQSIFNDGLQNVLYYSQEILNFNKLDFFNSNFKSNMDSIINDNMCNDSDDTLDNQWQPSRCEKIQQGILTQGLQNTMSKWYDMYRSFQQLGYQETMTFDQQVLYQLNQTYLSITLSNYTTTLRNTVKYNLSSSTQKQKDINLIISLVFISIVSVIYLCEWFKGMKTVTHRFQMAKKIIYLVPLQTAMIEETFIKILKAQSNRLEIVK